MVRSEKGRQVEVKALLRLHFALWRKIGALWLKIMPVDKFICPVALPVFLSNIPLQTQGAENFQAILAHRAFLGTSLGWWA